MNKIVYGYNNDIITLEIPELDKGAMIGVDYLTNWFKEINNADDLLYGLSDYGLGGLLLNIFGLDEYKDYM